MHDLNTLWKLENAPEMQKKPIHIHAPRSVSERKGGWLHTENVSWNKIFSTQFKIQLKLNKVIG